MLDSTQGNSGKAAPDKLGLVDEERDKRPTPLDRFLQKFRQAGRGSKPPSPTTRKELGKDRSKALFVLIAAAVAVFLFFLAIFSSPQKTKQQQMWRHKGQPDLGRRVTPGQANPQAGSVTPLLDAEVQNQVPQSNGEVTPEDIKRTSQVNLGRGCPTQRLAVAFCRRCRYLTPTPIVGVIPATAPASNHKEK